MGEDETRVRHESGDKGGQAGEAGLVEPAAGQHRVDQHQVVSFGAFAHRF